jgi:SRSO17 transposase
LGEVSVEQIVAWRSGLDALHARVGHRFARPEVRARAGRFLAALLARVERKNGWHLAEAMGEATPDGAQRLLTGAVWDADAVRDDQRAYVVEHLGDLGAILVIDETGFLKKGHKSAGVAPQYSGAAGGVANSQVGVFLAYAAPRGRAFLDRALYLPREWTDDPARCQAAGVPAAVAFATKPELAKALLARAFAAGVPAAWVTADAVYGQDGALRRWLEGEGRAYVLPSPGRRANGSTRTTWSAACRSRGWRGRCRPGGGDGSRSATGRRGRASSGGRRTSSPAGGPTGASGSSSGARSPTRPTSPTTARSARTGRPWRNWRAWRRAAGRSRRASNG